jgi:ABC-type glycerol-3-phosphate transport system substrate-binding protein
MEFSEATGQTAGKGTAMSRARTLSSVVAAAILTAACGGGSARAAAMTFRCTNPKSGTTWEVKVDYDRSIADSFPAKITGSQIAWHDTLHGGYYSLDRASGALTFQNASSTGGYVTHHTCHAD